MVVTLLIAAGIISLAAWLFQKFIEAVFEWALWILEKVADFIRGVVVFVKRGGRVISKLYKKLQNGSFSQYTYEEEKLHPDDVPEDIMSRLDQGEEVPVQEYKYA